MNRYIHKLLTFLTFLVLLSGCAEEEVVTSRVESRPLGMFQARVLDAPPSLHTKADTAAAQPRNLNTSLDFQPGDAFGLFVVDENEQALATYRNLKVETTDGLTWNVNSQIKAIVHENGYQLYAYAPYDASFSSCESIAQVEALMAPPELDQSSSPATDWLYTSVTPLGSDGITLLEFHHRYGRIDVFNGFENELTGSWLTAFPFYREEDEDGVIHYRYILDQASATTMDFSGTYQVGNALTGIRQMGYSRLGVTIGNGYHAIVRTNRVSEDYAVDLGLPSGILWAPFNIGAETGGEMTEDQILAASKNVGWRLSYEELWPKNDYSLDNYIDPSDQAFPSSGIAATEYDAARQLWGGHWEMPSQEDFQELLSYTTRTVEPYTVEVTVGDVSGDGQKTFTDVPVYRLTSKVEGYTDRYLLVAALGYSSGTYSTVSSTAAAYLSGGSSLSSGKHVQMVISATNYIVETGSTNHMGLFVRPVLKRSATISPEDLERELMTQLRSLAVDFGIRETKDGVEYAILWSPINMGAEKDLTMKSYNGFSPTLESILNQAKYKVGWYLPWGCLEPYADGNYSKAAYQQTPVYAGYENLRNYSSTDTWDVELTPEYDVAVQKWGRWDARWQMPAKEDFENLIAAVTGNYNVTGGSYGLVELTGKNTGFTSAKMLLPKTGYRQDKIVKSTTQPGYHTRTAGDGLDRAWSLWYMNPLRGNVNSSRYTGLAVRPIIKIPVSELNSD